MSIHDSGLEKQGIPISWKRRLINNFNLYHQPNQTHLPVNLFDLADKDTFFLGDHPSWGYTMSNTSRYDLLNATDDKTYFSS
ncbi:hypothetical protein TNCT_331311 [Trichonephila clavata]|uniref:Uncharacterized protein n=1 Tax=Trichonephila clavata TaxID=2740835 RepID=A0A8X6KJK4_TRICU|nr:hypothetical protein TNCT_331311 [Trichonephila clavata]